MPGWYCQRCGHEADDTGACPRDGTTLVRVSTTDLPGRRLGDYRILANIGGGAFGTVYRAAHAVNGAVVAIKLLHRGYDHADSQRVVVEAKAASMIDHPNCIRVYDLALTNDRRPYIVMQFLEGVPLSQVIAQRLSVAEAVTLASDILAGLEAAHARGVVHRDLKPANIFVANGRAIIVDFGLAKLIADPKAPNLTVTGEAIGTPSYMAPEQIKAGKTIDGRADLYAIGCVLYEMLANRRPFPGKATLEVFNAHLTQTAPPIASVRPDVPPRIADVITRALAKDVAERWQTAAEMRAALLAPPPRRTWAIVVGLLAIVAIVVAIVLGTRGDAPAPTPAPLRPDAAAGSGEPGFGRRIAIPPAEPGDPPLPAEYEQSLEQTATRLEAGMKRAAVVKLFCSMQVLDGAPKADARAYARRLRRMLREQHPDLDPADCVRER